MNNWEDEFSSYDIDLINAKASKEKEEETSVEEFHLPEPADIKEKEVESDLGPTSMPSEEPEPKVAEQNTADDAELEKRRQKVKENKKQYDQLLAKVGKHTPCVTKKDVEKAIAQLDECINIASQRSTPTLQDESTPPDKRQIKRQRILSKQVTKATEVLVAARCVGRCFVDFDQAAYYKHLSDRQFLTQTSMATRTFRERLPIVFKSETAQQAHDGIDKILVNAERLAKSLAEVIDAFPGEGGMMELLNTISQNCDDDEFNSIEHTIQFAAESQEE